MKGEKRWVEVATERKKEREGERESEREMRACPPEWMSV